MTPDKANFFKAKISYSFCQKKIIQNQNITRYRYIFVFHAHTKQTLLAIYIFNLLTSIDIFFAFIYLLFIYFLFDIFCSPCKDKLFNERAYTLFIPCLFLILDMPNCSFDAPAVSSEKSLNILSDEKI